MQIKERFPLRADFLSRFAFDSLYEGNETTVYGPPLTISDCQMKFNYNAGHFTLNGDNFEMGEWVGSTHIITIGTITTGVWQGTKIAVAYGGTGLTALGTANQLFGVNAAGTLLEYTSSPNLYGLTITQQNSAAGLVIKNAATPNSLYPPLIFQTSTGTETGRMYVDAYRNIIIGKLAGTGTTSGSDNIFIGRDAGQGITVGSNNIVLGYDAGLLSYRAGSSVFIGIDAGMEMSYADSTTIIGPYAGSSGVYSKEDILIGYQPNYWNITRPSATASAGAGLGVGSYLYAVSCILDGAESTLSRSAREVTTTAGNQQVSLTDIYTYPGPKTCTARNIYRTKVGSPGMWYLLTTINDNTTTTYLDSTADGALGAELTANQNIIAIGNNIYNLGIRNTAVLGGAITDFFFNGYHSGTPAAACLHSEGGEGANIAGSDFTIAPGQGTGTGAGGSFRVQVAPAGGAGSTWNALQDALFVGPTGYVGIGTILPKSILHVVGLPAYANNAAAVAGGLTAGAFYRTNADPDPVCVVH